MSKFLVIYCLLELASNWKVFVKYGEPGWKGLIPIYSAYIDCKYVWHVVGFVILMVSSVLAALTSTTSTFVQIISLVGAIVVTIANIMRCHYKSKAFGKGRGMTILLLFLPFIGNIVLGLGNAEYIGNASAK